MRNKKIFKCSCKRSELLLHSADNVGKGKKYLWGVKGNLKLCLIAQYLHLVFKTLLHCLPDVKLWSIPLLSVNIGSGLMCILYILYCIVQKYLDKIMHIYTVCFKIIFCLSVYHDKFHLPK